LRTRVISLEVTSSNPKGGRVCTCLTKPLFVNFCVGLARYQQPHSHLWEWGDLYFFDGPQCPKIMSIGSSLDGWEEKCYPPHLGSTLGCDMCILCEKVNDWGSLGANFWLGFVMYRQSHSCLWAWEWNDLYYLDFFWSFVLDLILQYMNPLLEPKLLIRILIVIMVWIKYLWINLSNYCRLVV